MEKIPYTDSMKYKMVILVRKDVEMSKGKACGQVAHACVGRVIQSPTNVNIIQNWYNEGQKKVVLKVESLDELMYYCKLADELNIGCTLVADAGRTELEPGTITCAAFGPIEDSSNIFKNLKLL